MIVLWYLLAAAVALLLVGLAVGTLLRNARRSLADSRRGRIPGPEAERFREGNERQLAGGGPEEGEE